LQSALVAAKEEYNMRTLNLNTAAVAALAIAATMPRLRVRENDGVLQIRPTDRENLSNLPAGEVLVNLTTKANARRASLPAEVAPSFDAGSKLVLNPESHYGWFNLTATDDIGRGTPGASIL
jgi:hypothetical protein